ncbi:MAG: dienelactone hydrolase family protein [Terracidiphilus sp.]|jgi:dienelactone hydrolase
MRFLNVVAFLAIVLPAVFVLPAQVSSTRKEIDFSSLDANHPYKVSGTLFLPENASSPVPAIVLVHGTMGIDKRSLLYRQAILGAGIAIFEVDFKSGIYRSTTDRPDPDVFLPLAFAALKELRKLPTIDPSRIGIMGFSLGGQIALRTAMESNQKQWMGDDQGFIAFATFYPVCKAFIKDLDKSGSKLTGGPIIVFYGTNDSYGEGTTVPKLKKLLAKRYNFQLITVEYPGATHGFNLNVPNMSFPDPAANGFRAHISWNPEAANDSITKVVAFLRENLAAK